MSFINSSLNASVHVLRTFVMRLTLKLGYYNLLLPVLTYYATTVVTLNRLWRLQ